MIDILDSFQSYSCNIDVLKKNESLESYDLTFIIKGIERSLEWSDLVAVFPQINSRDTLTLRISLDDGEPYTFKVDFETSSDRLLMDSINENIDIDTNVKITYEIIKNLNNCVRSVYDITLFCEDLNNKKIMQLINVLHKNVDFSNVNKFEVQNESVPKIYFRSNLFIIFSGEIGSHYINNTSLEQRETLFEVRKLNANPQKFSQYDFIPSDFCNLESEANETTLLFEKLKIVLSASFLANASDIVENKGVQFIFIGHKFLDIFCDFNATNFVKAEVFYKIYQWVYSSNDVNDKLDLSRNIISRYLLKENDEIILPNDTVNSIQSAHAIYLKENVEKYIETKNKVAEVTMELSIKSKDVVQYFISSFKNNNLIILSFFTSLFIFNTFSDNINNKLFDDEKYYVALVFLLISVVYLLVTSHQLKKDAYLNNQYFYAIKEIYKDIFDISELDKLFNDEILKENKNYVAKTQDTFSYLWLIEIILLLLLTICGHYYL